jgi:hypothetical protein
VRWYRNKKTGALQHPQQPMALQVEAAVPASRIKPVQILHIRQQLKEFRLAIYSNPKNAL